MKRLRRCKITTPSSVLGLVDLSYGDESEWNRDRGDDEGVGDVVRISEGPISLSLEMGQYNTAMATGYLASLVVEHYEIENNAGAGETKVTKTLTFTQVALNRSAKQNVDNPGRVTLEGTAKSLTIT